MSKRGYEDPNECDGCGCNIDPDEQYCMDCEPDSCEDCGIDIPQGDEVCDRCAGDRDDEDEARRQLEEDELEESLDADEEGG